MLVYIAYDLNGRRIERSVEFDGPENDVIQEWNATLKGWATRDTRWRSEGGTNADLVSSTSEVPASP